MTVAKTAPHAPWTIRIADEALCAAACREVYAQRPRWTARRFNGKPPFYTLGNAAYADLDFAKMPLEEYLAGAGSVWTWAGAAVSELLERVRAALEDCVAAPVAFAHTVPEPGFHIFIGAAIPRTDCARRADDCASSHFDLQYRYVPWERWYANADVRSTVSFTLPMRLPPAGGGLTIWDELSFERVHEEIERGTFDSLSAAAHATRRSTVTYEVGTLVVHSGHVLHQIAGVPRTAVADERITLQGHGVYADGAWRLYW
jgi:hypothetical protein